MARIVKLAFLLLLFIFGLSFAVLNSQPVTFHYYAGSIELPLSLLTAMMFATGALLGLAVSFGAIFRAKRDMAELRKAMQLAEKELENLRSLPLKDRP
jgi:uncharacterized integral membrane protein